MPCLVKRILTPGFAALLAVSCGLKTTETQKRFPLLENPAAGANAGPSASPAPSSIPSSSPAIPDEGKLAMGELDPYCMTEGAGKYDACIFFKNPVAQLGAPIPGGMRFTLDASSFQHYGVKLKGLAPGGFLESENYVIEPGASVRPPMSPQPSPSPTPAPQRAERTSAGNWKHPFSLCAGGACLTDPDHRVSQLMAFYWLESQVRFMKERVGVFYAGGKRLIVDTMRPNLANAFFDFSANQLVMGTAGEREFALSAEVYTHEAGHANLHYASAGVTSAGGFTPYCAQSVGCFGAIHEGQADYHAAILFPEKTSLGETVTNSMGGLEQCGSRDVARNRDVTALEAFEAPQACGFFAGEVHNLGRVYASIWWELRSAAGAPAVEIDRLFAEHLLALSANDDFGTAMAKILTIDRALFSGRNSARITAEFRRRGIDP